jgi:hypothetical protein
LEISSEYDEVEFTSFCSDYKEYGQGLGDCTWTIDFFQDFDNNKVDEALWGYSQSGATFNIRATPGIGTTSALQGSASPTNPLFKMTGRLFSYSPIAGAIGEASTTTATIRNAGSLGLQKVTTGTTI